MLNLILSVFEAWNSIGLLILASVFLLIGGGLVSHYLYWRMKAHVIQGRVTGLRVTAASGAETDESDDSGHSEGQGVPLGVSLFFFLFLMIFAGFGLWTAYGYYDLTSHGVYADAVVVRNDVSTDSDGGKSNNTVLSFTDRQGSVHEVRDTISYGGSPSFETGTTIGVYYDLQKPTRFVIDDFWHNMAIAIAFIAISSVLMSVFLYFLFFGKNAKPSRTASAARQRPAQETYYPVYEYKTPQGERKEFVDTIGANTFLHTLPGKSVRLLMLPGDPPNVKKSGVFGLVFGLIFLSPGLFIGHVAITQFKLSLGLILLLCAGVGFVGFKIMGVLANVSTEDKKKGWEILRSGEMFKKGSFSIKTNNSGENGRLLTPDEIRLRIGPQRRNCSVAGVVMLLIALGLGGGAYYAGQSMIALNAEGIRAQGEVVALRSRSSDDGHVYHAEVKFKDLQGKTVTFEDGVGASSPMFARGDSVDVLYSSVRPQDAIIDRGLFNWALSGGLAAGALLLLWIALLSLRMGFGSGGGQAYRTLV